MDWMLIIGSIGWSCCRLVLRQALPLAFHEIIYYSFSVREYNLQENTPFRRIGARLGYTETQYLGFFSMEYGLEVGVQPSVGLDYYGKLFLSFGLARLSHRMKDF